MSDSNSCSVYGGPSDEYIGLIVPACSNRFIQTSAIQALTEDIDESAVALL